MKLFFISLSYVIYSFLIQRSFATTNSLVTSNGAIETNLQQSYSPYAISIVRSVHLMFSYGNMIASKFRLFVKHQFALIYKEIITDTVQFRSPPGETSEILQQKQHQHYIPSKKEEENIVFIRNRINATLVSLANELSPWIRSCTDIGFD
jgi:hypothetical protein